MSTWNSLRAWPRRRWTFTVAVAAGYVFLIGIPTDLVNTPVFSRDVPPTWWAWPALLFTAALAGLLAATYVAAPLGERGTRRGGLVGGMLTYFAVGCPVCNKLALLTLGTSGALTWFAPLQPVIQILGLALLLWSLRSRLRAETTCRLTVAVPAEKEHSGV